MKNMAENTFFKGSDVDKITMIEVVRGILIDLLRGYPGWIYHLYQVYHLEQILPQTSLHIPSTVFPYQGKQQHLI